MNDQNQLELSAEVASYATRNWINDHPDSRPTVADMARHIARAFSLGQKAHAATSMEDIEIVLEDHYRKEDYQ